MHVFEVDGVPVVIHSGLVVVPTRIHHESDSCWETQGFFSHPAYCGQFEQMIFGVALSNGTILVP